MSPAQNEHAATYVVGFIVLLATSIALPEGFFLAMVAVTAVIAVATLASLLLRPSRRPSNRKHR